MVDPELLKLLKKFEQSNPVWNHGGGSGISTTLSNGYTVVVMRFHDPNKQIPYINIAVKDKNEYSKTLLERKYYPDGEITGIPVISARDKDTYTYLDSWLQKQSVIAYNREQTEETARRLDEQRKHEAKLKQFLDS